MPIYIVTFVPFEDRASVGGFDWFPIKQDAIDWFKAQCAEDKEGCYEHRLIQWEAPDGMVNNNRITRWIDDRLDQFTDGELGTRLM